MGDFIINALRGDKQTVEKIQAKSSTLESKHDFYSEIFEKTQSYVVKEKLPELSSALLSNDMTVLEQIVGAYIKLNFANRIKGKEDEYITKVMSDMTGYSFLNKYFAQKDIIEEININAWDAVEVRYCDGRKIMIDEHFHSPQHAKDVILRILQQNDKQMDENKVYEISYIGKAVRIATTISPIADAEIGIVASIRFIHSAVFKLDKLVENKMLTEEAAQSLNYFINNGVSICFCGSTGSGKTTICNALLETVPNDTRLITLEGGTREFDLIRRDEKGKVINNRVHLQTRPHKNKDFNIDLQTLLDLILKFDPDIVAVGEMVSEEAFIASETARTGHTVVTTIHTNNAFDAYYRMYTLSIRKYELDEKILLKLMVDAFPIIVYTKKYSDGVRRVQTILEGIFDDKKKAIKFNELYRYVVTDNAYQEDGSINVTGYFEKVNKPTERLVQFLMDNGLSKEDADKL